MAKKKGRISTSIYIDVDGLYEPFKKACLDKRGITGNKRLTELVAQDLAAMNGIEFKAKDDYPTTLKSLRTQLAKADAELQNFNEWLRAFHGNRDYCLRLCIAKLGMPIENGRMFFSKVDDALMMKLVNYSPTKNDGLTEIEWVQFIGFLEAWRERQSLLAQIRKLQRERYNNKIKTDKDTEPD